MHATKASQIFLTNMYLAFERAEPFKSCNGEISKHTPDWLGFARSIQSLHR